MTSPQETIAIVDFGSQFSQLIARRVRELRVFSILCRPDVTVQQLREMNVAGMILSGGPASVYADGAPKCRPELLEMGIPILGICYGMQLLCEMLGGEVRSCSSREFGRTELEVSEADGLFDHVPPQMTVWMSHGDVVERVSSQFVSLAKTRNTPVAAVRHRERPIFGIQFHPEVTHTSHGRQILENFVRGTCGCEGRWQIGDIVRECHERVAARVKPDQRVILGLSGGVDSSVTAAMLHAPLGDRLVCIFVDNGLLRAGEADGVEQTFRRNFHLDLRVVDASATFLAALSGVTDPQEKRKIVGRIFIDVFEAEARKIPNVRFLAQGTTYPDVIESGHGMGGHSAKIKLHHNVGGLPEKLGFELIEPLRDLFKDEVRSIGEHLGLPEELVWRHPFPGPGLSVRIIGPITRPSLEMLRRADTILLDEIIAAGWYRKIAQAFAVLIPVKTVGVMGDEQSYADQHLMALRMVESTDFMTADWVHVEYELLGRIATRIMNEVKGVNRVVYDVSSKPPATIEWE